MKYLQYLIEYNNYKLLLCTNDSELVNAVQKEYNNIFNFLKSENEIKENILRIKVIKSDVLYNKYFNISKDRKIKNSKTYCDVRRENILITDKEKNEILLLYDSLNDERVQHVEEIIIGCFGKFMEEDGFYFIHASVIEKNNKGIGILKGKNSDNTIILLKLLQNNFNFVCNSQVAIKDIKHKIKGISLPTRIGIKMDSRMSSCLNNDIYNKLKESQKYLNKKDTFNRMKPDNIEKFNLKINELLDIFKVNFLQNTEILALFELHYIPNLKEMKILKVEENEKITILSMNLKKAIYQPVEYIKNVFNEEENKKLIINDGLRQIKLCKVYLSYDNEEKLIEELNKAIQ